MHRALTDAVAVLKSNLQSMLKLTCAHSTFHHYTKIHSSQFLKSAVVFDLFLNKHLYANVCHGIVPNETSPKFVKTTRVGLKGIKERKTKF